MKETKSERREAARRKAKQGMRVTGKYFWIAIENSRAKRDAKRQQATTGNGQNDAAQGQQP